MIEEQTLKRKTISNFFWRFFERIGAQLVAFIVSIILARILSPEHYGLIALVTIITNILNVFIDSGLGNALIQKKDADNIDFSTVFLANSCFCLILYLLLFISAPYIAIFYKNIELIPVIRVLGLTIVFSGLKNVQQAYVSKNLMFRKFFFATLGGTIAAAIIGILMALKGFGVWALVFQQIINVFIDTCILWIIVPWKPRLIFSFSRFKQLFSFGWKLLSANLLHAIYLDIRQFVIGKVYSPSELAFYNQAQKFPEIISRNINHSIDSILFPVMSASQDDIEKVKSMTRRSIKTSSFIMWPLVLGLAGVSKNVVTLILTEKWLPCVPYLMLACFRFGMEPLQTANLNAIKAVGRTDIILRLEIVKKIISTSIIFITMPFGVYAIAMGASVYSLIASILNSFPNRKILSYSYFEQIKDIFPSFIVSLVMAFLVYYLPLEFLPIGLRLLIQILVGSCFYIGITFVFKFESFNFIVNLIKMLRNGDKK